MRDEPQGARACEHPHRGHGWPQGQAGSARGRVSGDDAPDPRGASQSKHSRVCELEAPQGARRPRCARSTAASAHAAQAALDESRRVRGALSAATLGAELPVRFTPYFKRPSLRTSRAFHSVLQAPFTPNFPCVSLRTSRALHSGPRVCRAETAIALREQVRSFCTNFRACLRAAARECGSGVAVGEGVREAGFTLVEVLVAMLLVAMIADRRGAALRRVVSRGAECPAPDLRHCAGDSEARSAAIADVGIRRGRARRERYVYRSQRRSCHCLRAGPETGACRHAGDEHARLCGFSRRKRPLDRKWTGPRGGDGVHPSVECRSATQPIQTRCCSKCWSRPFVVICRPLRPAAPAGDSQTKHCWRR